MDVNGGLYNIPGIPLPGILQRESIDIILTHYAQVSKEAVDLIVAKLVGPARITQKILHNLNSLQFKSQLHLKEVSSLLEDTYLWYKEMHGSFLRVIGSGLAKKLALLYVLPDYQLVFASLRDFDESFDTTSGIKIWKGKYLVDNCLYPGIAMLCDPTRGNARALKWLEMYYEEERDKKRRMEE
jgi:hypothetical protein